MKFIKNINIKIKNKCINENEIYSRKEIIEMIPEINEYKIYGLYELKINKYLINIESKDEIEEEEIEEKIEEVEKKKEEAKEKKEEISDKNVGIMNNICQLL